MGVIEKLWKSIRRSPGYSTLILIIFLLMVTGFGGILIENDRANQREADAREQRDRAIRLSLVASKERDEAKRLREVAARRGEGAPVVVSALTGKGVKELLAEIERRLAEGRETMDVVLEAGDGAGLAWLYENAEVLSRRNGRTGRITLKIRAGKSELGRIARKFPGTR